MLLAGLSDATCAVLAAPSGELVGVEPRPLNMAKVRDAAAKGLSARRLGRAGLRYRERPPTVVFAAHRAYVRYRALSDVMHTNLDSLGRYLEGGCFAPPVRDPSTLGVLFREALGEAELTVELLSELVTPDEATPDGAV